MHNQTFHLIPAVMLCSSVTTVKAVEVHAHFHVNFHASFKCCQLVTAIFCMLDFETQLTFAKCLRQQFWFNNVQLNR